MENLTRQIPIIIAVLLDEGLEQAVVCMAVIATAALIIFHRHRSNQVLGRIKRVLNRHLMDQALQELLIELKSTGLSNLVCCVDCDDSRCRIDTFDKDLTETL